MSSSLDELQKKIGYHFSDLSLLTLALTHSSFANEHRQQHLPYNERIEFLGDAVLELASSEHLYHDYPDMSEGDMTKLRASLVCEPTLAVCARNIGLPAHILLGKGEEITGGRLRDSIVSDALEALIGAIYLDGGYQAAAAFVEHFVMNDIEHKKLFYDSKTVLQEMIQKKYPGKELRYVPAGETGPDHARIFTFELYLGAEKISDGSGSTKKSAQQQAAYRAILTLGQ